jgi:hypothetical protein
MNALSYEQGIDDGIRMATLKEKRKLKAYRKAVKNIFNEILPLRTALKTGINKKINAEYRRILKEEK